jgi:hypothetical protein
MTITAIASKSLLLSTAESAYPATGVAGQVILLSGDLISKPVVPDPLNGWFAAAAHGLSQGTRIRLSSTGNMPAGFAINTDYWAIIYSTGVFGLASSLDNAIAGTSVLPGDAGTGTITVAEQELTSDSLIEVLISKELTAGGAYQRLPLVAIGQAAFNPTTGAAEKPPKIVQLENTGANPIAYRYVLIALGASSVIGSTAGITGYLLGAEVATQTILPGATRIIQTTLKVVRL